MAELLSYNIKITRFSRDGTSGRPTLYVFLKSHLAFPSGGRGVGRVVSKAPDEAKVGRKEPRVKYVLIAKLIVSYPAEMIQSRQLGRLD